MTFTNVFAALFHFPIFCFTFISHILSLRNPTDIGTLTVQKGWKNRSPFTKFVPGKSPIYANGLVCSTLLRSRGGLWISPAAAAERKGPPSPSFFFPEVRTYTMATDRSGQVELLLRTRKQIRGKGLWIKANEVRTRGGLKISKSGKQGLPPFPSTPLPLPACIGHTFQPCPSPTSLISSCHCSASLTKRNVDSKIDKHFSVGKLS